MVIFGSSSSLSPIRRYVINWTNVDILLIGPIGNNFHWNWNQNTKIAIKIQMKMYFTKFC